MDPETVNYHYCDDLPTAPLPKGTKVLVTGANGYVGHRLIPELVARGYHVKCMLRDSTIPWLLVHPRIEPVYADCLQGDQLLPALEGVEAAYYLIHSMRQKEDRFRAMDLQAAKNFNEAVNACGVKKVIYLGGLGETDERMSDHLRSRQEVGHTLAESSAIVIRLRAGIIIGTGSASYELLKSLVQHHRFIPFLPEFNSQCQPIAVRDVVKYLVGMLETPGLSSRMYPIGGREVLTYKILVQRFARSLNRRAHFFEVSWVPIPVSWMCRIFAYWLNFFVSVPVNIVSLLLNSLKTDVVCGNEDIRKTLPFETVDFDTSVKWALEKEKRSQVYSHWGGAPPEGMDLMPLSEYEASEVIHEEHQRDIPVSPEKVFQIIRRIGGDYGWVHANTLWKIRGVVDKMLGGVGLNRGRRDPDELKAGDAVDFWRVEKIELNKELLLRGELLNPGLSWLQFKLEPSGNSHTRLTLKAHFIPFPFWGKVYWGAMSKFHNYIFTGMLDYFYNESLKP